MSSTGGTPSPTRTSATPTPNNFMAPPVSTTPKRVSSTSNMKNTSEMWDHFTKNDCENRDDVTASCNYCGTILACPSRRDTSCLCNHLSKCKKYHLNVVNKRQKTIVFQQHLCDQSSSNSYYVQSSLSSWKFDQDVLQLAVAKMVIVDEVPFSFVESEGFRHLMNVVQPRFKVPSRKTVATDCFKIYIEESQKLKKFFSKFSQRVCLTIDTWTSCQNLNYMCLTAHFIDDDWQLQKKILNFCPVTSHKGLIIGKTVESCLLYWGISNVFTITVDNASSNDVGISYLKTRLASSKGSVLDSDFLHMRCCAHILSLIVKEVLKDMDDSIFRIRSAVRYVRSSPSRLQRFKECVEKEKIENKNHLVLDVETRWNSTYLMLDVALKFQKAFDLLEIEDSKYRDELTSGDKSRGLPTRSDWEYARYLLPFLKVFYDATLRVSGSLFVTGNAYMQEIYGIGLRISTWCKSDDLGLRSMAEKMKGKHDKYWSNVDNINVMLFVAVVLDPRYKLKYVDWVIDESYDVVNADKLKTKVKATLLSLVEQYSLLKVDPTAQSSEQSQVASEIDVHDANLDPVDFMRVMFKKHRAKKRAFQHKSDLDKYLEDDCEVNTDKTFDILKWWKINSTRYQVLSWIARDLLAMPVSTVASESIFSTGGHVLDLFRSSLTHRMVEALICTRDWIRTTREPFIIEESLDELSKIESEFLSLEMENSCADMDDMDD